MQDVRNCRRCGKIYNYIGGLPICPACKEVDEADFKRIKEYLYKNPGASMSEVSTVLDINVEKIKKFLKEGRLEIVGEGENFILECEGCGKPIKTGRLCEACARGLTSDLKSTASKMSQAVQNNQSSQKGIGMRHLHREGK